MDVMRIIIKNPYFKKKKSDSLQVKDPKHVFGQPPYRTNSIYRAE